MDLFVSKVFRKQNRYNTEGADFMVTSEVVVPVNVKKWGCELC